MTPESAARIDMVGRLRRYDEDDQRELFGLRGRFLFAWIAAKSDVESEPVALGRWFKIEQIAMRQDRAALLAYGAGER